MSKGQMLRCLVSERLTAAAEEISALFERTISEYEEELCRSKEENERKQQLLDSVVLPRVLLHRSVQTDLSSGPGLNQEITETAQMNEEPEEHRIKQEEQLQESSDLLHIDTVPGVQTDLMSSGPGLNQEITETPQMIEEPEKRGIKQEEQLQEFTAVSVKSDDQLQEFTAVSVKSEEQLQEFTAVSVKSEEQLQEFTAVSVKSYFQLQEFSAVSVKSEEQLLEQSEPREEPQGEDCGGAEAETEEHTDDDEASSSTQQMEMEADGDHYNHVTSVQKSNLISHFKSSPETSDTGKDWDISGSDVGVKRRKHECSVCKKTFRSKQCLQIHTSVHTGEKPYSCSVCKKTFSVRCNLNTHMRIHTGEKPYRCSICQKTCNQKISLTTHMRTHTGEKPYSCSICQKTFTVKCNLNQHMRKHHKEEIF